MTANHHHHILSTTQGYPARWNDKTLVLFDWFVQGIYDGDVMNDVTFKLLDKDDSGLIFEVNYKGEWLIVDNGYMRWSTTILPVKIAADQREIHWSEWLESLRKDVEDTFGILKGCWHILKTGIHLHGVEVADNIWKTCCALHNMLLEINGLDVEWSGGIGMHDEGDVENYLHPFTLDCLQRNFTTDVQNYDASNMGPGDDIDYETVDDEPNEEGA
jgi:hypothetical protein